MKNQETFESLKTLYFADVKIGIILTNIKSKSQKVFFLNKTERLRFYKSLDDKNVPAQKSKDIKTINNTYKNVLMAPSLFKSIEDYQFIQTTLKRSGNWTYELFADFSSPTNFEKSDQTMFVTENLPKGTFKVGNVYMEDVRFPGSNISESKVLFVQTRPKEFRTGCRLQVHPSLLPVGGKVGVRYARGFYFIAKSGRTTFKFDANGNDALILGQTLNEPKFLPTISRNVRYFGCDVKEDTTEFCVVIAHRYLNETGFFEK